MGSMTFFWVPNKIPRNGMAMVKEKRENKVPNKLKKTLKSPFFQ